MFSELKPRPPVATAVAHTPNEPKEIKSEDGSWVFHGSEYIWTANTDTT